MNTLSITQSTESCNTTKNNRPIYTLKAQGRRVYKSSAKQRVLKLRGKRVANRPLYNNDTLVYPQGVEPLLGVEHTTMVTVGLKYKGAERKYQVPVMWKKDSRGNSRAYITIAEFLLLPRELQDTAAINGVNVSSKLITFSRCCVAWSGQNVKGMHVHHVNMHTTDDRLGNLWVMTPQEHAAVHSDKDDLVWDEDWYEYTSGSEGLLRIDISLFLTDDDYAEDLDIPDPDAYEAYSRAPLDPYVIELIHELQKNAFAYHLGLSTT